MKNFVPFYTSEVFFSPRIKTMTEVSRRPTMQEIQAQRRSSVGGARPAKSRGMSLPNLDLHQVLRLRSNSLLTGLIMPECGQTGEDFFVNPWFLPISDVVPLCLCFVAITIPPKPVSVFKLPDFPSSMSLRSTQSYYCSLIQLLDKEITCVQSENPSLLARCFCSFNALNHASKRCRSNLLF